MKKEPQSEAARETQNAPTPRPWHVVSSPISGSDGAYYITPFDTLTLPMFSAVARLDTNSSERDEANAELICRAVNSFEDMKEALKRVLPDWDIPTDEADGHVACEITNGDVRTIRAALAKAESPLSSPSEPK